MCRWTMSARPFGFGLSYSSFKYEVAAAPATVSLAPLRGLLANATSQHAGFIHQQEDAALSPPAEYQVRVTNTGGVAADDASTQAIYRRLTFERPFFDRLRVVTGSAWVLPAAQRGQGWRTAAVALRV